MRFGLIETLLPVAKDSRALVVVHPDANISLFLQRECSRDAAPAIFAKLSSNVGRANSSLTCALAWQNERSISFCLDFFVTFFIKKKSKEERLTNRKPLRDG